MISIVNVVVLIRKFISPWLFGSRGKKKSLDETVGEMNTNLTRQVAEVAAAVQTLSETVAAMKEKKNGKSDMQELKVEVASLKALLLARRQFPAPPSVGPPSIPAWQLAAAASSSSGGGGGQKMNELRVMDDCDVANTTSSNNNMPININDSLSSSPEIISVEDMPGAAGHHDAMRCTSDMNSDLNSTSARDPSESSETGSAEMVDMAGAASGEDTD